MNNFLTLNKAWHCDIGYSNWCEVKIEVLKNCFYFIRKIGNLEKQGIELTIHYEN